MPRRVAVTGLGVLSPLGVGVDANWRALCAGESGIGPITRFDTTDFPVKIAGEVRDFDPTRWLAKRELRQMDVFIHYAIACAAMAVEQAGLDREPPEAERYGVYVGAGLGGITTIESTIASLREKGPRHGISPYFVPALIINLAGGQISIRHKCKGPNMGHVSACATGAHAIGEAARVIAYGEADVMIAGGSESTVTPVSIGGFASARALSTRNDEPTRASRPFTASRDGFVLSEGAGILVLEAWEHAKARGAEILAELVGYGRNADAYHVTLPSPDGEGAQRCMRLALADAGLAPEAIGYINAHGTSTAADSIETKAVRGVFGKHADGGLVVSSTKSMTGHLLGAAGSFEAAVSILALREGIIPPTINLDDPDPACDLDYVPHRARELSVEYAMSNSFGFGGTNAALIFRGVR
ncbi:MAG: beta-ketoacyl-ACP synthase II [Myxococcales bacterium]|nr:beta-ketoacyl-ACP synthase II [Myxococcales bacterium]MCB9702719.1 beta-ketoacyl-ACP synthase II [Myxococcales bacterium]